MTTEAPKLIHQHLVSHFLPKRDEYSHKGSFGSALILAGSQSYTGAALLAGRACLRSGVGLLFMAIPKALHAPLAGQLPEAIWELLAEDAGYHCSKSLPQLEVAMENKTAFLVGPGYGLTSSSQELGRALVEDLFPKHGNLPTVIDADMLTILSRIDNWHHYLPQNTVLTPHPGEMARLTGLSRDEIQANRAEIALSFANEKQVVLILKGANTLVATPQGELYMLPFAHSLLAHGGSGDVLAGLLTGLLAQGMPTTQAACLAVWLHAKSGLLALEKRKHAASVLPSDLIDHLGMAMAELEKA
jgi:NAD(P)H-hydrate epimerase